jgi:putative SOS response-associated peptidase YedK
MCGRYLISTDKDYDEIINIINEVSDKYDETNLANGEIFPTNNVPVIYNFNGRNILSSAKWGFPNYKNNGVIINARCETVLEKPMFRNAFVTKRCLVPANAYYEWLTQDKKKVKYQIGFDDRSIFFMAGLYNKFTDKSGVPFTAITIITTEAKQDIAFIHNRMPVILNNGMERFWLSSANLDELQSILKPYDEEVIFKAVG